MERTRADWLESVVGSLEIVQSSGDMIEVAGQRIKDGKPCSRCGQAATYTHVADDGFKRWLDTCIECDEWFRKGSM